MNQVFINSIGVFLPNNPISNDEMEDYLSKVNGQPSNVRHRILKQNGIQNRYYALDKNQETTHSNATLAALAIDNALKKSSLDQLFSTGTT